MAIGIELTAAPQNCHMFMVCQLCPTVMNLNACSC